MQPVRLLLLAFASGSHSSTVWCCLSFGDNAYL